MNERLKRVIVEMLGVDETLVTSGARLEDDLGADSLDHIEITMAIEEEFSIEITDEQQAAATTVGDMERWLQ